MIFLSFIMSRKDNKLRKDESLPICERFIQNKPVLPAGKCLPGYHRHWCLPILASFATESSLPKTITSSPSLASVTSVISIIVISIQILPMVGTSLPLYHTFPTPLPRVIGITICIAQPQGAGLHGLFCHTPTVITHGFTRSFRSLI